MSTKKYAIVTVIDCKLDMRDLALGTSRSELDQEEIQYLILDRSGETDDGQVLSEGAEETLQTAGVSAREEELSDLLRQAETFDSDVEDDLMDASSQDEDPFSDSEEEGEDAEDGETSRIEDTVDLSGFSIRRTAEALGMEYHRISENCSLAEAYNAAFELIRAEYVCFSSAFVSYDRNLAAVLDAAFEKYPTQSAAAINYRKSQLWKEDGTLDQEYRPEDASEKELLLRKFTPDRSKRLILFPFSYFYSLQLIGDTRFEEGLEEEVPVLFLLNMLQKMETFAFAASTSASFSGDLTWGSKNFYGCREKDFYIPSLKDRFLPFLKQFEGQESGVPVRIQRAVLAFLFFKYFSNYNARDKFILIEDEIPQFLKLTGQVLTYIDDEIIMGPAGYRQFKMPFHILNLFMCLKYDKDTAALDRAFFIRDETIWFRQAGQEYRFRKEKKVTVQAINVDKTHVTFDAYFFTEMLYQLAPNALYAVLNGKKLEVEHLDIYAYDKVFGLSINKKYTFRIRVEKKQLLKNKAQLGFVLQLGENILNLGIAFNKPASRLNRDYRCSYWYIDDQYYLKYTRPVITVFKGGGLKDRVKNEVALQYEMKSKILDKQECDSAVRLRTQYLRQKKKLSKRRIWLYFDKLYKGGDNGEYQFRHDIRLAKADGVECYYIVNADAACYPALKKEFGDHILEYGTPKCKLYALAAETIVATGPEIMEFTGFGKAEKNLFRDLFDANLICIAHGITIQKNANVQNRLYDNTMFYTTSSKYEVAHIKQPVYGYTDEEIALTGMARFDGLKNNDQKQILITPTWRINLVAARTARNAERGYFSQFKNSSYFRIYNSLINDERLIEAAKRCGYRIIFLLHPLMSSQINDYDRNDYVELMQATGDMSYEKILTESSLMVTDYSGIHYDFGYMRKPIIYYQPKEVPARFEEGGMKFATMGFGPLTTDYDEAVNLICRYMENGCVLEDLYLDRADDFFAFHDFNNCDRIHDAMHKWVDGRKITS